MPQRQQANWQRELESTVDLLWRTDSIRHVRLEPLDEIKMGLYYLEEILFNAVPELYEELEQRLAFTFPCMKILLFHHFYASVPGSVATRTEIRM